MGEVTQHLGGAKRGVGETKELVAELHAEGWSVRKIAIELDISTQSVYLHLNNLRAEGRVA